MPRPRNSQELLHWLEMGAGARWIRRAAVVAGTVALSLLIVWKQFHGPESEITLLQADVGRQLAAGEGFTTLVNYPQTAALLKVRGVVPDAATAFPELYQAPLYSLVIAGALRVLPRALRESLFTHSSNITDGYGGDFVLLGVNLLLFWAAAWLTFDLGRRLFAPRVGWLAALAVLVSLALWQETLAVNGTPLLMVLALVLFSLWHRVDVRLEAAAANADAPSADSAFAGQSPPSLPRSPHRVVEGRAGPLGRPLGLGASSGRPFVLLGAIGASCGLLFLTEYSAGTIVVVVLGYAMVRFQRAQRWLAIGAIGVGFLGVASPWLIRNMRVAGHPVALAAQNVALKFGDPTAEPSGVRATLSPAAPPINLRKLGNKTLTTLQENVKARLWSGGAMWFAAFFAAGWLYAFRSPTANRMRWVCTAALAVALLAQAALGSGESDRLVVTWVAPLIVIFGAGFFFVLLESNPLLGAWPRLMAAALVTLQALPLVHDAAAPPPVIRFHYPPYFPALMHGMKTEFEIRRVEGKYEAMADLPAGVAWYGRIRVWAQPPQLKDFYALTLDHNIGELLLTPHTLDKPFFSELNAHAVVPGALSALPNRFGEWGEIYGGLLTGTMPRGFPLSVPHKVAENLFVLLNPAMPPPQGK